MTYLRFRFARSTLLLNHHLWSNIYEGQHAIIGEEWSSELNSQ